MQGIAPALVEELTELHGPMCEECLKDWRTEREKDFGPS